MIKTEVVHLRIEKDIMDQIRKIAETEDRPIQQVLRRILKAYFTEGFSLKKGRNLRP